MWEEIANPKTELKSEGNHKQNSQWRPQSQKLGTEGVYGMGVESTQNEDKRGESGG